MTDLTPERLAEIEAAHAAFLAELTQSNFGVTPPAQWRLITGDTYLLTCIGPVCPDQDQHQRFDDGEPDTHGQFDCCPGPVVETYHEATAAWLVELLDGFPGMAAEIRRLRADITHRVGLAREVLARRDADVDRLYARIAELEAENTRLAAKEA